MDKDRQQEKIPSRIKLDLEIGTEVIFKSIPKICAFLLVILVRVAVNKDRPAMADLYSLKWPFIIISCLAVISLILYKFSNNYYILDFFDRALYLHTSILHISRQKLAARFKDLNAVSITGIPKHTRSDSWWEYAVVLVLQDGSIIRVSDYNRDFFEMNAQARRIAELICINFTQGRKELLLLVQKAPKGGIQLCFVKEIKKIDPFFIYVILAVVIIFVIMMIWSSSN